MALVVDTSIFISLERQRRPWQDFLATEAPNEPIAIASITASELLAGTYRADTAVRRRAREEHVEDILQSLLVLSFDLVTARTHSRLWAELDAMGQAIGRYDLLIAATAVANSYAVLTENVREFARVPGLEVRQRSS
jgi:tRNA(fMet)-specific endonuclease VapC